MDVVEEAQELKQYWQERDVRILQDREVLNLTKPIVKEGKIDWVLNDPKTLYETAVALLSSYSPRFRLPLTINYTTEQKEKISKAERFLLGILRYLDNKQYARGQSYWLRELAYWICSGWYAVFVIVTEKDGKVDFRADLFDPITVYPEWDADGLIKLVRTYETDGRTAKAMAESWKVDISVDSATVKVINYWRKKNDTVYNAIYVGDEVVKPLREEPFERIPIFVGAIGNPDRVSPDWFVRAGENIIAANKDLYAYRNVLLSLMTQIVADTAYPNIITGSTTGEPVVKAEDVRGYGTVIPKRLEETIELLKHAATPPEVATIISFLGQAMQKGGLPDIVYGGAPFELSGFAISQLMASIRYKISPYLNTMQNVISEVATEFLNQYKKAKYPKVSLSTTNPKEISKGLFFVEEFSPKDVPDSLYVDVIIPLVSPLDKTQQIMFARQAMQPPQLLSRETIWDDVLDVQDAEQEYTRIIQDQTLEMPIVKQIAMIEHLRAIMENYRRIGKVAEADALKRYIMGLEMQLGMRQGIPIKPSEAGVPPQTMPPEAGASSPDVLRSILGMSPPGIARRPMTPQEREERLVGPTGQPL